MKKIIIATILLCFSYLVNAQERYAVLIAGNYDNCKSWNKTLVMWRHLKSQGYSDKNIFVFFANGVDYYKKSGRSYYQRYRKFNQITNGITDYSASTKNIQLVFNHLEESVKSSDSLFVWAFKPEKNNVKGCTASLQLVDGNMTDGEFYNMVNSIHAHKEIYWKQDAFPDTSHKKMSFKTNRSRNDVRSVFKINRYKYAQLAQ